MQKLTQIAAALAIGASISVSALAADKAFVKVNGASVSQNLADAFIAEQKAKGAPDSPELRNAIREELIRRELLLQEARKSGLDKKPDIAAQAEAAKQAILIRSYVQDYVNKHPIKDEQLQSDYDKIKAQVGSTEYKARHILVEKEEEAKAIIAKLEKGEKFSELAKQSKDPGSKDKGGELGWSSPAAYVKPFGEALTKLKKGEYTKAPVQSDFGYHVIQLDDSRPSNPPPFDQVKPQLQQRASQQQIETLVKELRSKAKVD